VRRILVTGLSGTGKSTALAGLERRGFETLETDVEPWSEWSDEAGGYVWDEERVNTLLRRDFPTTLFVSGTVSNQGRFYDRFDEVVLLSAPAEVLLARIGSRTTNPFGKTAEERERILADLDEVEPLLRATCTLELDATQPVEAVVARLAALA
jgi:adenylate kinase family enzyme